MAEWMSIDNPVFRAYAFYATLLCLKIQIMFLLTAIQRKKKGVYANAEDTCLHPQGKVQMDDPDVERVRRGHRNDLENIIPFLVLGLLYAATNPMPFIACWAFRIFTFARFAHTFVYVICPMRQPFRFLAFLGGVFIFANPEDAPLHPKGQVKMDDPDVERVRRGHLNDLENIPVFLILGLLYVATRPALSTALWCFRIFVVARYIHTFVYVICPLPQPARGLSFMAGVLVNLFMAVNVLMAFF